MVGPLSVKQEAQAQQMETPKLREGVWPTRGHIALWQQSSDCWVSGIGSAPVLTVTWAWARPGGGGVEGKRLRKARPARQSP